ncbi:hypothetical protein CKQ90_34290, partial [Klebsiella pneumoniae]
LLNDFFLPDSETEAALALIEQQWLAVIDSGLEAQQRPLAEWLPVCRDLLNDFFLPDSETEAALALIEQQWLAVIDSGLEA